jgi:hypothetical protein
MGSPRGFGSELLCGSSNLMAESQLLREIQCSFGFFPEFQDAV